MNFVTGRRYAAGNYAAGSYATTRQRSIPYLAITTPEGVPLRFEIASATERFIAMSFDLLVVYVSTILCVFLFGFLAFGTSLDFPWMGSLILASFLFRYGYFVWFETRFQGSTPGKKILSLRVVSRDGDGLGWGAVTARNIFRDFEFFLPVTVIVAPEALVGSAPWWLRFPAALWAFVFALLPLFSKFRLRAGDLAGGTAVVRIPKAVLIGDEAATPLVSHIHFEEKHLQVYGVKELEVLARLLRDTERRRVGEYEVAIVAKTVATKIDYQGYEAQSTPHIFLKAFYRAQRASLEKRLLFGKRKLSKLDQE